VAATSTEERTDKVLTTLSTLLLPVLPVKGAPCSANITAGWEPTSILFLIII
jgi:hypothetical protein